MPGADAEERALQMLGLARRAGRLVVGTRAVLEDVGKLSAVVLAEDAGDNARSRLSKVLGRDDVPVFRLADGRRLGEALGRGRVVVAGLTDRGFARKLAQVASRETGGQHDVEQGSP